MNTPPPLLAQWLVICDRIAQECAARALSSDAYRVAVDVAAKLVWSGGDVLDDVVSTACQVVGDPARLDAILLARAADESARRKDSLRRAYRRAEADARPGGKSTKRRGSPHATHRSNKRTDGERWDLREEGDE